MIEFACEECKETILVIDPKHQEAMCLYCGKWNRIPK